MSSLQPEQRLCIVCRTRFTLPNPDYICNKCRKNRKTEYVSPLHRPVLYKRIDSLKAKLTVEELFKWLDYGNRIISGVEK